MPYVSEAQRRWAHTASGKKALGGEAGVHEWDEATKGKKLPEKVEKSLIDMPKASKLPKPKMMPKATDKPSKFWKSEYEEFTHVKHPSLMKLRDFILRKHKS